MSIIGEQEVGTFMRLFLENSVIFYMANKVNFLLFFFLLIWNWK